MSGIAGAEMVKLLENGPPKVAVLGPTLSESTLLTGQIAAAYNVLQVIKPLAVSAMLMYFFT